MFKNDGVIVSGPDGVITKMPSIKKAIALVETLKHVYTLGKFAGKRQTQEYGEAYVSSVAASCGVDSEKLSSALAEFGVRLSK